MKKIMTKNLPEAILKKLQRRRKDGSFRELMIPNGVDFFSNDYLGAARIKFSSDKSSGSTGSRSLSGNSEFTLELEKEIAAFFQQEAALLYNSGYDANLGLLSALPGRNDTILYDALCHASIRDGIYLSNAKNFSFRHNDIEHLKDRLSSLAGTVYVVVESIYSMDGDEALLDEIAEACEINGAFLIVDEAHAGGIYGESGRGLVSHYQLDDSVFAKVVTYGKAFGSHGAFVLGSEELVQFLINFSRAFIFTTALSPHAQDRLGFITRRIAEMDNEREKLSANIQHFRKIALEKGLQINGSQSGIQLLMVPGIEESQKMAATVREKGFMVKAILSPTVANGEERIRICLHSFNTFEEIEDLIETIG
ncbi:8-amino-7-oxononanoate synthase [Crocinitomix catalasitica]|nr:8-amino-7-oxononanoate synthase [Crocinitomix catalasitica]